MYQPPAESYDNQPPPMSSIRRGPTTSLQPPGSRMGQTLQSRMGPTIPGTN